jgi:hypothetical protein
LGLSAVKEFFEALRESSLVYWNDKPADAKAIAGLLSANTVLIVVARAPFHGWDRLIVSPIAVLLSFLLLALASVAAIFRSGSDMPTDAYNLGRSVAVAWLLSLMLATPAILPPLRGLYASAPPWAVATIIVVIVNVGFFIYSLSRPKNRSTRRSAAILPGLFVGVVSWLFFWSMIMDDSTNDFLEHSATKIAEVFGHKD